jgi:hypothetical protein
MKAPKTYFGEKTVFSTNDSEKSVYAHMKG